MSIIFMFIFCYCCLTDLEIETIQCLRRYEHLESSRTWGGPTTFVTWKPRESCYGVRGASGGYVDERLAEGDQSIDWYSCRHIWSESISNRQTYSAVHLSRVSKAFKSYSPVVGHISNLARCEQTVTISDILHRFSINKRLILGF